MDVIISFDNNAANDMAAIMSGLISDLDNVIKTMICQSLFSDCSVLSR